MDKYTIKLKRELKMWLWIASIVPFSYVVFLCTIWYLGINDIFHIAVVAGSISMFVVAVIWFIWAMRTIHTIITQWDRTQHKVGEILVEVKTVRSALRDVFFSQNDK